MLKGIRLEIIISRYATRMDSKLDQFLRFVSAERGRHHKRGYLAGFLAILIAVLLYETQWLNLRSGLLVLLAGQVGDVLALFLRSVQFSRDLDRQKASASSEGAFSAWFEREELFIKRLALFDSSCQMIGFLALGYEFWITTGSLGFAVAIGVVYPAAFYLGMIRRKTRAAIRQLRAKKQELASL
jgi:hypothetical protein